jgi:2-polyprenyl-6-methoxyphenol hydroxylase-like FAD-dependent oxidoreductase
VAEIVVIGGGIAGSAAALALHKAGFEVAVHEAHPQTGADIGAFLTLANNGMQALAQLDAAEPVTALGFPLTSMKLVDAAGTVLATAPLAAHEPPLTRYRCLRRAELGAALQREVERRGIALRHGARLVSVTEEAAAVTAHFADGTSATGALLVGADGLRSAVRAHVDPDGAAAPHYAGQSVYYGYTEQAVPPLDDPALITMVRGSRTAFGYAVSPAGETYWFARVAGPALTAEETAGATAEHWQQHLLPLMREDDTPAAGIVAATGERLMATNAVHLTPGNPWRTARTVLIGDAAHAASPATGQGASMALEDAVVLAKALREAAPGEPPAAALAAYERHRRPRTERNMAASAQLTASRDQTPAAAAPPRDVQNPVSRVDEDLMDVLDWKTPLPTA